MRARVLIFFYIFVFFLCAPLSVFASTIFSQEPTNENLNGPILNSPYLVMFECPPNLGGCTGTYGKTVYNIGVWIKKVGNPADIMLQVVDTPNHYPVSNVASSSNPVLAKQISSIAYALKWFYFPNGVVISSANQFFMPQFAGAINTSNRTNYYQALYDPVNSYNAPMQWCKVYLGCNSSKFFWKLDDANVDLSLPPPPTVTLLGSASTTVELGATFTDLGATASDDTDGDITNAIRVTGSINTSIIGTTILAYAVTNSYGISATTTRAVVVACIHDCNSSVLFVPGIESSRLYRPDYTGGTDQLWEPNIDGDVKELYMNADGTSTRFDVYAKERDVIDELPNGENIYKSFIAKMDGLKAGGTIADWVPVAYDWRLSLDDILTYGNDVQGRIYYSGDLRATSTPYITQELKRLAASSRTGKVTIIAHSNGGLLAKRLTELLGPTESAKLIDKMILVAVPQAGTPAAVAAGLHGYDQEHLKGLITSKLTARTFANNAPMMYSLLPSAQYFTYVDDPVVTFDSALTEWVARYGASIHSQEQLKAFLTDTFGRVDPQTGDINQPIQANGALLTDAETLHTSLDSWVPPAGVALTQIAGWGVPKTVEGITYKKKGTGVTPEAKLTIDGDGTVVAPSALWVSTTTGATNYWVDLKRYSNDHWLTAVGGFHPFNHAKILETDPVLDFISDQIASTTKPLSDYVYLSTQSPSFSGARLRYALHSPLTLNLYDAEGRHTGVSTTTGEVEEQIPGTYYTEFGDVKYLFSDAATNASIIMNGYDTGTFTLNVDEYSGNTVTTSTTFKDVPTTASTVASLSIQTGSSTLSSMVVDESGDGSNVITLAPIVGETVTYESSAPAPAPAPQPAGSISLPVIAPLPIETAVALPAIPITQPIVALVPKVAASPRPALVKNQIKKKLPVAVATIKKQEKKADTNVAQTAAVANAASQQPGLRGVGAAVYNGWQGFWSALKRIF